MRLYHHTSSDNRGSILKDGLSCSKAQIEGAAIYLTTSSAGSTSDVWAVDVTGFELDLDVVQPEDESETWYAVYQDVSPNRLSLIQEDAMNHTRFKVTVLASGRTEFFSTYQQAHDWVCERFGFSSVRIEEVAR